MQAVTICCAAAPPDAGVLRKAQIEDAQLLVAATDDDIDNLAIAVAARQLAPDLQVVVRRTQSRNAVVFRESGARLVMATGYMVATEVLRQRAPLLAQFLQLAARQDEAWAAALLQRLRERVGDAILESWAQSLRQAQSFAELRARVEARSGPQRAVPLMRLRQGDAVLVQGEDFELLPDDLLLMTGCARSRRQFGLGPGAEQRLRQAHRRDVQAHVDHRVGLATELVGAPAHAVRGLVQTEQEAQFAQRVAGRRRGVEAQALHLGLVAVDQVAHGVGDHLVAQHVGDEARLGVVGLEVGAAGMSRSPRGFTGAGTTTRFFRVDAVAVLQIGRRARRRLKTPMEGSLVASLKSMKTAPTPTISTWSPLNAVAVFSSTPRPSW